MYDINSSYKDVYNLFLEQYIMAPTVIDNTSSTKTNVPPPASMDMSADLELKSPAGVTEVVASELRVTEVVATEPVKNEFVSHTYFISTDTLAQIYYIALSLPCSVEAGIGENKSSVVTFSGTLDGPSMS